MRADRLISILMMLQMEGRMTAAELARRLEVSERTIYRDMDALSISGVPVYADPGVGGGFVLPANYKMTIGGLTTAEIQAVFMHLAGGSFEQLGIGPPLRSALLKLLHALPDQSRRDAEWIQQRIYLDPESWSQDEKTAPYLQAAQQAIWEQHAVTMTYTSREGHELCLKLKPYGLVAKAGVWFLVGETEGNVRAFRLLRIDSLEGKQEERFVRPEDFDLQVFWQEWLEKYESR
ncbi:helix-turn-helix transcriptional regulator [Paenibacillus thalictri]|uniref:WYL domain-containing protein n=1 Tax=Paenibacillus thalictri TaxID=2527873 RepID=A0A4Q9DUC1_9BACL|nr:WYL domain-containing protein [Paenibacillus thalictri]TBL80577.1 WYL domain-containing protein [Paenibacillus thalictri]